MRARLGLLGTLTLLACGQGGPSTPPRPAPDVVNDRPPEASAGDAAPDLAAPDAPPDVPAVDVSQPPDIGMDGAPVDARSEDAPPEDVALDASAPEATADVATEAGSDAVTPEDRPEDVATMDAPPDVVSMDAAPDVAPGTCPTTTDCEPCVRVPGCGSCNTGSTRICMRGNGRGPTSGTCAGRWVPPEEDGQCLVAPSPTAIVRACTTRRVGAERDCGWRTPGSFMCTPGRMMLVGCAPPLGGGGGELCPSPGGVMFGICSGNPVLRVCAGVNPCLYAQSLVPTAGDLDNHCNQCPVVRVVCPPEGRITTLGGPRDTGLEDGDCMPTIRAL